MINRNKVIITGAAGFVGSNFVDYLLKKNFKVIGIDNLKTGKKKILKKCPSKQKF